MDGSEQVETELQLYTSPWLSCSETEEDDFFAPLMFLPMESRSHPFYSRSSSSQPPPPPPPPPPPCFFSIDITINSFDFTFLVVALKSAFEAKNARNRLPYSRLFVHTLTSALEPMCTELFPSSHNCTMTIASVRPNSCALDCKWTDPQTPNYLFERNTNHIKSFVMWRRFIELHAPNIVRVTG